MYLDLGLGVTTSLQRARQRLWWTKDCITGLGPSREALYIYRLALMTRLGPDLDTGLTLF